MARQRANPGKLVARTLAGAWLSSPPPLVLSEAELADITSLLLDTGAGALSWWRARSSSLATSPAAQQLHHAYRFHTLQVAIRQGELQQAVTLIRSAGVEALLAKGWAIGRLYPEPGLRPYVDIDLYVRSEQYPTAMAALREGGVSTAPVDLHRGFADLDDRPVNELYRRSQVVTLGDADVRILGPEDHLRLLCIHQMRHGLRRPLWLCDIAVVLESNPPDFDWNYLFSENPRRSHRVACVLSLAHQLLGARSEGDYAAQRANHFPSWLVPSVLHEWGGRRSYSGLMATRLRRRAGVLKGLRQRWPNPIEATVFWQGPINKFPRVPFQLAEVLVRTLRFGLRLLGLLQKCTYPNRLTKKGEAEHNRILEAYIKPR